MKDDRELAKKNVNKIIEHHLLSYIAGKLVTLEQTIRRTRKGFSNTIKSLFKAPDRADDAGLKEGFKMNKSEVELRTLVDLAFIV